MGLWNTIKNAAQSVGHFVKKNWKVLVGVAAAVAIPFAAPVIGGLLAASPFLLSVAPGVASFLGGTLGSGLIGAGLGAGAAAVTGQNPLLGAALGGLGGGAGSLMGAGGLFGIGGAGSMTSAAGLAAPVPASGGLLDIGGATVNAATGAAANAATTASTASLGSIATQLATNPKSIGALAQLAMVMFNKDVTKLTPEEKARLQDAAQQAATNKALFERTVEEARKVMQMGTPNPEQAYADARMSSDARMAEAQRGMPVGLQEANARKGAIEGTKLGTQGIASDYVQAAAIRKAGASMLPSMAPEGYAGLALPIYNDLYSRQNAYDEQLSKAVGGLFGSLA